MTSNSGQRTTNLYCANCGTILYIEDCYAINQTGGRICNDCFRNRQDDPSGLRKMNRRSTDFQAVPAVSANIPGTQLCTKCGNKLFSKECWCYDDPVNHPQHYTSHPSGVECIQITEYMNFCIGNAIKYLWRADQKDGIQDLEKASWYINREIERRKQDG